MPPGGRPSGGVDPRRRREWMQWQQAQASRFEDVDSEDDGYGAPDRLRFTGYDIGSGKQRDYDDMAYGDDYEMEDDYGEPDEGALWQMEVRRREEEAYHSAMRRMNRARLRGDKDIPLSREEIDALEKRQVIPRIREEPQPQASTALTKQAAAGSKAKKRGTASPAATNTRPAPKGTKALTQKQSASQSSSRRSSGPTAEPIPGPESPSRRPGPRSTSGPVSRQQIAMPEGREYRPVSSSSRPSPYASDADVRARNRSASNAQYYGQPYPYGAGYPPLPAGPGQYAQYPPYPPESYPQRRNISGPAALDYPAPGSRPATSGRREREVIVISDDDDDEEASDEDSDDGVALEPVPETSRSGYAAPSRAPAPRARRGGR